MKAARIHRFGPPDVIVVDEIPRPSPGPGEVLVRVVAAGVGPWDALIREGKSKVSPQPPLTLGSDLSGVVEEVGAGVMSVERFLRGRHPIFRAKKKPDLEVFSDSDIEALDHAVAEYGNKTAAQLSQDTHNEPAWKLANEHRAPGSSVIMDYRLFFEGHPEAADMLRFVEAQQEDRDAAEELAERRIS